MSISGPHGVIRSMTKPQNRKIIFLSAFLILSIVALGFGIAGILPTVGKARDQYNDLNANGINQSAKVVSKRQAYVDTGFSNRNSHVAHYVTLEFSVDSQQIVGELRYDHGGLNITDNWKKLQIGESVAIKYSPNQPELFYAPLFLEITNTPRAVLDGWYYMGLAASVIILIIVFIAIQLKKTTS